MLAQSPTFPILLRRALSLSPVSPVSRRYYDFCIPHMGMTEAGWKHTILLLLTSANR